MARATCKLLEYFSARQLLHLPYQFEFHSYCRRFRRPLRTSCGVRSLREGIVLQLVGDDGKVCHGEIAPLPEFGSETLEAAIAFCRQLGDRASLQEIRSIPNSLPACQFGFESAIFNREKLSAARLPCSRLLPAGEGAIAVLSNSKHHSTFKWKIGVGNVDGELEILSQLVRLLPPGGKLRLDANGGLNWGAANRWLQHCDELGVEFLEQPLPVAEFDAMQRLRDRYATPIALDESVATLKQMQACYQGGWRGIFVVKPCIAGYPSQLYQFCRQFDIDTVFSSVFETAIAREFALRLAATVQKVPRAVGFGVEEWIVDSG